MIHPHFHIADLVKGIAISIPCIFAIWAIVGALIWWRDRRSNAPDPYAEPFGDGL